jgi:hypothetical protein
MFIEKCRSQAVLWASITRFRLCLTSLRNDLQPAAQPVRGTVYGEYLGVVQKPIQDGRSEHLLAEELRPLRDALVGSDNHGAFGVATVDQLEEAVGVLPIEGQVAYLVADEKLRALVMGELLSELAELVGPAQRSRTRSSRMT